MSAMLTKHYEEMLDAEFKNYVAKVYPGAPPKQVVELRRTFYAGAWMVSSEILVKNGSMGEVRGIHEAAYNECALFYAQAQKDIAIIKGEASAH